MLKYVDTLVSFSEVPDEISLCINISNCPCKCEGCHSSYLAEDIGDLLTVFELTKLIRKNKGITCVAFLGGDSNPKYVNSLSIWVKTTFPELKVAWYSGKQEISDKIDLQYFNYVKVGPYIKDKGPLTDRNTNQKMYKVIPFVDCNGQWCAQLTDITFKFWK